MSILLKKGSGYNAEYASTDFPVLTADWVGSVSLYTTYPGSAIFTKALTLAGNKLLLALTAAEIINLNAGVYSFVTTISNPVLGVTITSLEYATVTDATVFDVPMTKLYMTLAKTDNTPAGRETRTLTNDYVNGTQVVLGWAGLQVTVANPVADKFGTTVIDMETTSTMTNAAGYAEIYVIKGLTVSVTCPGFGTIPAVNTTGLDSIDLSTYF
jgi:hypothetical protein